MAPVVVRLMGDEGRLEMNGFVISALPPFVGEAKLMELSPATRDGVSGVFVSERDRCLEGVFGGIAKVTQKATQRQLTKESQKTKKDVEVRDRTRGWLETVGGSPRSLQREKRVFRKRTIIT